MVVPTLPTERIFYDSRFCFPIRPEMIFFRFTDYFIFIRFRLPLNETGHYEVSLVSGLIDSVRREIAASDLLNTLLEGLYACRFGYTSYTEFTLGLLILKEKD